MSTAAVTRLDDGWTLVFGSGPVPGPLRGRTLPARVPGSVHTDLLEAGALADPYAGTHELDQGWVGSSDVTYACRFRHDSRGAAHTDLVLDGVDTIATVRLNGVVVGECDNMHARWRFDIRHAIGDGDNVLEVAFRAPLSYATAQSLALGPRPHVNAFPYNAMRKMACSFGWDWGPMLATSGLWKPVRVESYDGPRLDTVSVAPTQRDGGWVVSVTARVVGHGAAIVVARVGGVEVRSPAEPTTVLEIPLEDPVLWWPRGWGEQHLYTVDAWVESEGTSTSRVSRRFGLRTAEIIADADEEGTGFQLRVNGRDVRVRGANWIPADALLTRVDSELLDQRLTDAEDCGMNLLRVWGGGIYETDEFYDACDARGILVWQDFLFACAAYAEEEPLRSAVEREARENVERLSRHPSLVVLNGNNENLVAYEEWGWPKRLEGQTWGRGYYDVLLPQIVEEIAPHIPYTPGSPYSPRPGVAANDPDHGTVHVWDVWNQEDYTHYAQWRPRFVSEFGWQAPPAWATLTESLDDDPLTPESPGMVIHQKAIAGNDKLTDGLTAHLPLPRAMRDWHWAMQLNQAHALRFGIEHFRSLGQRCTGTIVWQLNDCWPVTSWALVDSAGRRKPAFYAVRDAYAERLIHLTADEPATVRLANDSDLPWTGTAEIARVGLDGRVLAVQHVDVSIPPAEARTIEIDSDVAEPSEPEREYVRAALGSHVARRLFVELRDSRLDPVPLTVTAAATPAGVEVTVVARSLAWDVAVLADVVEGSATVDSMLVTLDAGEGHTFLVETDAEANEFLEPGVVRTANDLLARP